MRCREAVDQQDGDDSGLPLAAFERGRHLNTSQPHRHRIEKARALINGLLERKDKMAALES
jgi:hypothetical protein